MSTTFRASVRAGAMALLQGYADANSGALKQIYPGRPMQILPPCAFIDTINEPDINYTASMIQRTPRVAIRLVKGVFDSAEAVAGMDTMVDGFIQYVLDNRFAAGAKTLVAVVSVDDEPGWIPEWMDDSKSYFSTLVTVEGLALDAD